MNIGLLCDEISRGWYPTNLVRSLEAATGNHDSIYVYTFGRNSDQVDGISVTSGVNSFLYPFRVAKSIRERDIDVFHVQFEFVMCNHFLGTLLMPLCLLLGRVAGAKIVVTLHGPIHEPGKLEQLSALSPYESLSFLMPVYFVSITTLLLLLSHRTIVHGEVFKERVLATYPIPESRVTAIQHGVVDED